jgi:hypothetical protein
MGRKDSEVRLLVYSNTKAWPVSAYAVIAGLTLCFAIGLHLVCSQAGESYRAVGFNDGQIDQGERIVQSIRHLVRVGGLRRVQATRTDGIRFSQDDLDVRGGQR